MRRQKEIENILKSKSINYGIISPEDNGFAIVLKLQDEIFTIVASWGLSWDHVSIDIRNKIGGRVPTWNEMCMIKDIFWNEDECVIQYHPAKTDYVNYHPYTLHLWKPQCHSLPCPPRELI